MNYAANVLHAPTGDGHCRPTVVRGRRTVDLAVPADAPITAHISALLHLRDVVADDNSDPVVHNVGERVAEIAETVLHRQYSSAD